MSHIQDDPLWRIQLKQFDQVFAIKPPKRLYEKKGWSTGRIINIADQKIYIEWDNESLIDTFEINSQNIAPIFLISGANEWRQNLRKNDLVDCCDISGNWYLSTIIDTRISTQTNETKIKEVLIGFRTYSDKGIKIDDQGNKYTGWSITYDEWINNYSNRIQK